MELEAKIADLSFSEGQHFLWFFFLEIFPKKIYFFSLNYLTSELRRENSENFLDFCEKCLWNLGGLIECCDRLFGARNQDKWAALDAQILLHTQFFIELPLIAELQPVEVPTGRPNIGKKSEIGTAKCTESALCGPKVLKSRAAKSMILEFRPSPFINHNQS